MRELAVAAGAADALNHLAGRWTAHDGLAAGQYRSGDDARAERHHGFALEAAKEIAAGLSPERAEKFLAAVPLRDVSEYR